MTGLRALAIMTAGLLICTQAQADDSMAWLTAKESRTLAQHRYIPALLQQSAFVTTHFGVRQGFSSLLVPNVGTELGKKDLRASGFTQTFDLGIKLYEVIGLYATASGTVKSGLDSASALEMGATLDARFLAGGVLRLFRFSQIGSQLSMRMAGGLSFDNAFNVDQFIDATKDAANGQVTSVDSGDALALLITPARSSLFYTSFHFAQTIVESVGLQTELSLQKTNTTVKPFVLSSGQRIEETRDDFAVAFSVALSFDAHTFGVPLAVMPEYQVARETVKARRNDARSDLNYRTQRIGGGLYYSGRENLVLGVGALTALHLEQDRLEWKASDGARKRSGSPSQTEVHFILRYVW